MITTSKSIVVIGSINMDLVSRVERIPTVGETLPGLSFQTHPGGKGANQAVAAARLGATVHMVGRVGSDAIGSELRNGLQRSGVDVSAVRVVEGASGVASIMVSEAGDNCIVVTPGANAALTPTELDAHRDLIREAGIVLAQLEIPMETVMRATEICKEFHIPLILDPAPALRLPSSLLGMTSWVTPNETEASFYIQGEPLNPKFIVQALRGQGASGVILKLGRRGVYLSDLEHEDSSIDAFSVDVVDTTAAGDAFNGAFAVSLLRGDDAATSARFASAAAAISVTRHGAQSSMPTMQETQDFLLAMSES